MYFRRKTADYFRSNFSSIQSLILRFGYLWCRSKVYTLPFSGCFPVCPTILVQSPQGPIRGHREPPHDNSDDEPDSSVPTLRPSTVPTSLPSTAPTSLPHSGIQNSVCAPYPNLVHHPICSPPPVGDAPPPDQRILFHLLQILFQIANPPIQL